MGFCQGWLVHPLGEYLARPEHMLEDRGYTWLCGAMFRTFTLRKLECFRQARALHILAWNKHIGPRFYHVGFWSWGNGEKGYLGAYGFNCQRWNSWICWRRSTVKAFAKNVFIDQEWKLGDRRWSDTVLVLTINYANLRLEAVIATTSSAPYEKSKSLGSGGSMVARLKLKGIDGRALQDVYPVA